MGEHVLNVFDTFAFFIKFFNGENLLKVDTVLFLNYFNFDIGDYFKVFNVDCYFEVDNADNLLAVLDLNLAFIIFLSLNKRDFF